MTQLFLKQCERVLGAAEKALKRNGSVGPIYGSTGILGECKKSTVFRRGLRFIPKGCETVAGGRSAAKTTGMVRNEDRILEGQGFQGAVFPRL